MLTIRRDYSGFLNYQLSDGSDSSINIKSFFKLWEKFTLVLTNTY